MTMSEGTFHKMLKAREGPESFYHTLANHGRGALSKKRQGLGMAQDKA